jgi:hypothetical protein
MGTRSLATVESRAAVLVRLDHFFVCRRGRGRDDANPATFEISADETPADMASKARHDGKRAGGILAAVFLAVAGLLWAAPASAQRLENQVAIFSALDKVTATIKKLEVPLNQTIEFGQLKVTPRVCYSRPPTEQPKTTSFVEVEEVQLDGQQKKIFSGWMFAESPGLNAVEHPVFDVWLTGCEKPTNPVAASGIPQAEGGDGSDSGQPGDDLPRRRVRR